MKGVCLTATVLVAVAGISAAAWQVRPGGQGVTESKLLDISGAHSRIQVARQEVIRDSKRYVAVWREHLGGALGMPMPVVDFTKYDVIAAFAGSRTTGGYSIQVDGVKRVGKTATVQITLLKPDPHMMTTQAFTAPYAFKAVPKLPATVKFKVSEVVRGAL